MNQNCIILLLHGAGGNPYSLYPLMLYLSIWKPRQCDIEIIPYHVSTLDNILEEVDEKIKKIIPTPSTDVIVVGQSLGRLIANKIHTLGWNVKLGIYIVAPLHGAKIIAFADKFLPTPLKNKIEREIYRYLKDKNVEQSPPHDYHTISATLGTATFGTPFDGCVFKNETMFDITKHTNIEFSSHWTIFYDVRLFRKVYFEILNYF